MQCDEVHPRCGNCEKHGVVCDFENPDVVPDLASNSPADVDSPRPTTNHLHVPSVDDFSRRQPSPAPPQPTPGMYALPNAAPNAHRATAQVSRLMELRLMHHFTAFTSKTLLTSSPVTENIWAKAVPELAFAGRTYLTDAILSIAALHLRSQTPDDKEVIQASHAYSASTLAEYCSSLESGITQDNAEALFLTATLIAFQAVASRIFVKDDSDPGSRYMLPTAWFHAFQGVKTVVATSWQYIRSSNIVKTVIDSQPSLQLDLNPLAPESFFGHLLHGMDEELATEETHYVHVTNQCYSHAVCVLNWAHKSAYPAASLAFPATVARRFIELVEAKRPRALAILACFFALLKRMDGVWWLHDVARREVMGLVGLFESGSNWWKHLEWPIRIALWDGSSIPTDVWGADTQAQSQNAHGFVSHIELMAELMGQSQVLPTTPVTGENAPIAVRTPMSPQHVEVD